MEGLIYTDNGLQTGEIHIPEGEFRLPDGELRLPEGELRLPDGELRLPDGELRLPEGESLKGNLLETPSFVDVHVHFREPGNPEKETIRTGSEAALHGGYTTVCAMPNLDPAPDSVEHLAVEQRIIDASAVVNVLPYATITVGRKGREVVDVEALSNLAVGFTDDGSGLQDRGLMREAMQRIAAAGSILAAHCEVNELLRGGYIHDGDYCRRNGHKGICSESEWRQVERDLELAKETGVRYHVCHISTARTVELIRQAKADGVDVSCETAPHYLVFTDEDLRDEGRFKMNPPIRAAEDREALIEGVADGTIDMVATDHAPHTADQKGRGLRGSAMGVVGLETAFGAMNTFLARPGLITLERLVELMALAPRRRFGIQDTGRTVVDLDAPWRVDPSGFASKGRATPFEGMELRGKVVAVRMG